MKTLTLQNSLHLWWLLSLPLLLGLILALNAHAAENPVAQPTAETLRLGEQMYRDGILPSGEPIEAFVSGDIPVDGTAFTCISCHQRSGMGSIEGEVITPPTNGRILYLPREPYIKGSEFVPSYSNYAKYLSVRPAYTDETLATLIASGVDPTGRSVLKAMPRYNIDDQDMAILISYLKTLSDQPPPGVSENHLSFATVIVEGSDPVAVESMVLPLQFSVDRKNSLAVAAKANDRVARMGYNMLGNLHGYTFSLARWTLKGAPETWRAQLEDYYRQEPVFALLGGISPGTWEPVHRFCEDHRIPDLFPIVDDPVLSTTDWYTLYLSRGTRQEGEAAARYLKELSDLVKDKTIVQVTRDNRRGLALAEGFQTTWQAAGHAAAIDIKLSDTEPLSPQALEQIIARAKPDILLIWDGPSLLTALAALENQPEQPGMIFASGTWLDDALWDLPVALREKVYLTWPYRLPQEDVRFDLAARKVLAGKRPENYDPVIIRQAFIAQELLGMALMEMRGEYYRDYLLDTIGMMQDQYFPLYERLSFGPGQRYASKGCFIVQLGTGEKPQLERRSEWVMP